MHDLKTIKILLYITAFIAGACGMIIEFIAVRLVSPFLGSAMDVWSVIIIVVMAALACGYFLGHVLSSRFSKNRFLLIYLLICMTGFTILLSYFLFEPIVTFSGSALELIKFSVSVKTFLTVFMLFFLPILILGSIYPLVIQESNKLSKKDTSGLIFAISTLGSMAGIMLVTYILIPAIGAKSSFITCALVLEILAIFGLPKWLKMLPIVGIIIILRIHYVPNKKQSKNTIFYKESIYQPIKVVDIGDELALSLSGNESDGFYSSRYSPDKFLTGAFYDNFLMLPFIKPQTQKKDLDVLIIGLGAGTFSRQYHHYFSQSRNLKIDGVEIDSEVIDVGKKYFELEQPSLSVYIQDGRTYLNNSKKSYDIIMIDVYARQNYIPFHLSTQEFMKIASVHLKENGVVAYNVSDGSPNRYRLNYVSHTMASVFPFSYFVYSNFSTNYMVIGSARELNSPPEMSKFQTTELQSLSDTFQTYKFTQVTNVNYEYILTDETSPDKI